MLVVLNLCMVLRFGLGLVGDKCEDESAEEGDAGHGCQQDVARNEGCFEFGLGFVVHGFGFGGKKKNNVRWRAAPLGGVSVRTQWDELFLPSAFCGELSVRLKI